MKPNIGLEPKQLKDSAKALVPLLADLTVAAQTSRGAHWNVTGDLFGPLHDLFGETYEELGGWIDVVAERIRALGEKVQSTLGEAVKVSECPDADTSKAGAPELVEGVLATYEAICRRIRGLEGKADCGTENMLLGILECAEKRAWMLRAHLEGSV
jgi:starvation-inducible DNA-binding protein